MTVFRKAEFKQALRDAQMPGDVRDSQSFGGVLVDKLMRPVDQISRGLCNRHSRLAHNDINRGTFAAVMLRRIKTFREMS